MRRRINNFNERISLLELLHPHAISQLHTPMPYHNYTPPCHITITHPHAIPQLHTPMPHHNKAISLNSTRNSFKPHFVVLYMFCKLLAVKLFIASVARLNKDSFDDRSV
ncbi:hypothetical protein VCUG_02298 [Vavraia culicis subsp. floridensis]|uniref:Uncharacterized protein n=1 Tax=Vavraia culicis (isolate floridensis) TaxID=948595 RepID=L2GS60_VAVCU|nr:uncharacterized protein VCUG_02298 [Vavraia culicis subsp. floridensis]ELA46217.1 hypothetical protein VCUG_02298 [Vavraia culicis subsp. floridensis]